MNELIYLNKYLRYACAIFLVRRKFDRVMELNYQCGGLGLDSVPPLEVEVLDTNETIETGLDDRAHDKL